MCVCVCVSHTGVIRASLLNAGQCATYDSAKRFVMRTFDWGDDVLTHTASASLTGLVTTTVTNPADVVKTYMYVHGTSVCALAQIEICT